MAIRKSIPSVMLTILILVTVSSRCTLGCFPMETVFEHSTLWSQDLRKPWIRSYVIGQRSDDVMTVETQAPGSITEAQVTCLKKFSDHRYLVKVEEQGMPQKFQCLKFIPLTQQVVRKAQTKLHHDSKKVNCETEHYTEDDEVMIAYHNMSPEACPLSGGYQMLLHEGENIQAHCLDTVQTYNPRLEFACSGDHVLADFGKDCAPLIPIQDQSPYRLPFAYLQCVGSWDEYGGKIKVVLLQSKSDPYSFWCMHYKPVKGSDDELLTIHLSFNGKCLRNVFKKNRNAPDIFYTFGILAKFIPSSDMRCFDADYNKKCQSSEAKCFETNECPSSCQRCNKKIVKQNCGFTAATGHWTSKESRQGLIIDVKEQGFKVTEYGIFSCTGFMDSKPQEDVYLMARNDPLSTCLPFYVCAKVSVPSPGVLNFFLQAAERDPKTGRPSSCVQYPGGPGLIIPEKDAPMITLLNTENLPSISCNIPKNLRFPSGLRGCLFALRQCSGACNTLYGDYDKASCGNNTFFDLEHEHKCHARLQFRDGIQGIITSSTLNQRYLCWMYTSQQLYVTVPENCNSEGASFIFDDSDALLKYCPFNGISLPQKTYSSSKNRASDKICKKNFLVIVTFVFLLLFYEPLYG